MRRAVIAGLALLLILGGEARQAGASTRPLHLRMEAAGRANQVTKQKVQFRGSHSAPSSEGTKWEVEDGEWREERCRFRWLDGRRGFSDWEVRRTIRCAVDHWPVYGGFEKALAVASCESGLNELAFNAGGCNGYGCGGVFQQHLRYWDGRFSALAPRWWRLRSGVFNGRSNVVVSIRMAHAVGWYADWACA